MAEVQEVAFEDRYLAQRPFRTNAQEAAVRVYNRDGLLVRSDPFVGPKDRNGNAFAETQWKVQDSELPEMAPPEVKRVSADPLVRFRQKIIDRAGAGGIHTLGRSFRIMDKNRDWKVTVKELDRALELFGLPMQMKELQDIMKAIDKNDTGTMSYNEFMVAIRGKINPRRRKMIEMAYKVFDKNGDGKITIEDLRAANFEFFPDVLDGKVTSDEALDKFLSNFDSIEADGSVTLEEFMEYYKNVSASIDNDDYFELMIRNAWHIPGGEGWMENTSNTRVLVIHNDGVQKVVMIENDLGLDIHDYQAVMKALTSQGVKNIKKFALSGPV